MSPSSGGGEKKKVKSAVQKNNVQNNGKLSNHGFDAIQAKYKDVYRLDDASFIVCRNVHAKIMVVCFTKIPMQLVLKGSACAQNHRDPVFEKIKIPTITLNHF
jgi:hypothetical protein